MKHLIVEFCAVYMQNLKLLQNKMKRQKPNLKEQYEKLQSTFSAYYNPIISIVVQC